MISISRQAELWGVVMSLKSNLTVKLYPDYLDRVKTALDCILHEYAPINFTLTHTWMLIKKHREVL